MSDNPITVYCVYCAYVGWYNPWELEVVWHNNRGQWWSGTVLSPAVMPQEDSI